MSGRVESEGQSYDALQVGLAAFALLEKLGSALIAEGVVDARVMGEVIGEAVSGLEGANGDDFKKAADFIKQRMLSNERAADGRH